MSFQNIVYCIGHITGGHKKYAKFVAESFSDPMDYLYIYKKLVDLHMFDGSIVCIKSQNIFKVVYPIMSCIVGSDNTCHNVFNGWAYIEEKPKLCRDDKVC